MDAVGAGGQSDVHPRVDQNARAMHVGQPQYLSCEAAKIARGKIFLAELDQIHALLKSARDAGQERRDTTGGVPVCDVVAQHQRGV